MMSEYKYFTFFSKPRIKNRKTDTWECLANSDGCLLGHIKWYSHWRQYCFFPARETIFSQNCLDDVSNFLEKINQNHKNG